MYLRALHVGFFVMFDLNLLRGNFIYKYHYFVKHLIQEDDCVVDLGANLGFYTKIFCRLLNKTGKVIVIEPVKPFFETIVWGLRNYKNCVFYNNALGLENKTISLTTPKEYGYLRPGLSNVTDNPSEGDSFVFESEMVRGSDLLRNLEKINYIKCDIEGYEEFVIPEIKEVIQKHKPILQIETWGTQKEVVAKLMTELNYAQYSVYKNKFVKNFDNAIEHGDYIFIHESKEAAIVERLKKLNLA